MSTDPLRVLTPRWNLLFVVVPLMASLPLWARAQDISQLQALAAGGDAGSQLKLAQAYEKGEGVPQDPEIAFRWYRKAADQGDARAQNRVGEMYRAGEGVPGDKQEAVRWYQKSARQGNAEAMCNLGAAYYNGDGVSINDSLSYAWFLLEKEKGCDSAGDAVQRAEASLEPKAFARAFGQIASMYEKGEYLPTNQSEAARWWLKAAMKGDTDAELATALHLLNGSGVPQDFGQGRSWCNEARKADDARGAYCMGYIYQRGLGAERDAGKARKFYAQATARRYVPAMRALADMEASGEGGKVDRVSACLLYARLAARGDIDALRSLAKVKGQMDSKEWKKVADQLHFFQIDRRKLEDEIAELERYSAWARGIGTDTKSRALIKALQIGFSNMADKRWKWGMESVVQTLPDFRSRPDQKGKTGVYFKSRMNEEGTLPLTWWDKKEYSATEYGTNLLKDMFGDVGQFSFPKAIHLVED
jgi:TPR repeat protein